MYKIACYLCGSTCTNSSSRVYIAAGSKPRATTFTTGNILLWDESDMSGTRKTPGS